MAQCQNRRRHRRRAAGGQGIVGQGSAIYGGPGYAYGYPVTIVGTGAHGPIYGWASGC
ncbi:MAG TPA: hypothetical protein VNL16_13080 [Chloroflexota bacterium]|nr:hypothetical protein [Chloroflexota bacterium]